MKQVAKWMGIVVAFSIVQPIFAQKTEQDRLQESATVLKEIMGLPENGIPHDLINKAVCVVVYPSVKKGRHCRNVEN